MSSSVVGHLGRMWSFLAVVNVCVCVCVSVCVCVQCCVVNAVQFKLWVSSSVVGHLGRLRRMSSCLAMVSVWVCSKTCVCVCAVLCCVVNTVQFKLWVNSTSSVVGHLGRIWSFLAVVSVCV